MFTPPKHVTCTAAVEVRNADLGPHADHFCKMVLIWFSFAVTGLHLHEKRWWTARTCSSQFSTQHTTIHCSAVQYSQGTRDIKRLMAWYHCYPESCNKSGKSLVKANTNSRHNFFTSRVQFCQILQFKSKRSPFFNFTGPIRFPLGSHCIKKATKSPL